MPLTPRQQLFLAELPKDWNATQASIRAGYSAKTARAAAARLLADSALQQALAESLEQAVAQAGVDTQWVLDRAVEVVERCMQATPVRDRKGEWQFEARTAVAALTLISRWTGGFAEKTTTIGGDHRELHFHFDGGPDAEKVREAPPQLEAPPQGRNGP